MSMKQQKKKIPNRVSGTNGDEKTSEKPVPEEAPPSAEAQVRLGFPEFSGFWPACECGLGGRN